MSRNLLVDVTPDVSYYLRMPPTVTAKPDGAKIRALIREWAQARGVRGEVTPFARKLGPHRNPQSIFNICSYEPPTGIVFLREIAAELGVRPSDISDMSEGEPQALAS
jgi:hypothetical protein